MRLVILYPTERILRMPLASKITSRAMSQGIQELTCRKAEEDKSVDPFLQTPGEATAS